MEVMGLACWECGYKIGDLGDKEEKPSVCPECGGTMLIGLWKIFD